jgi:hypothetical protein
MKVKQINAGGTMYEVTFNDSGKVSKVVAPAPDGEISVSICHPKVIEKFEAEYAN